MEDPVVSSRFASIFSSVRGRFCKVFYLLRTISGVCPPVNSRSNKGPVKSLFFFHFKQFLCLRNQVIGFFFQYAYKVDLSVGCIFLKLLYVLTKPTPSVSFLTSFQFSAENAQPGNLNAHVFGFSISSVVKINCLFMPH